MRPSDDLVLPVASATGSNTPPPGLPSARWWRRLLFLMPLVGFVALAAAFALRIGTAARWLDTMGDPYTRTGADLDGRVGIDLGVYGVPETFVIDAEGRIAFKQIGPVTSETLDQTILPLVRKLRQKGLSTP